MPIDKFSTIRSANQEMNVKRVPNEEAERVLTGYREQVARLESQGATAADILFLIRPEKYRQYKKENRENEMGELLSTLLGVCARTNTPVALPESFIRSKKEILLSSTTGMVVEVSPELSPREEQECIPRTRYLSELLAEQRLPFSVIVGKTLGMDKYVVLYVAGVHAMVFVCDTPENATYIVSFDPTQHVDPEKYIACTKTELYELGATTINYTEDLKSWNEKILECLTAPQLPRVSLGSSAKQGDGKKPEVSKGTTSPPELARRIFPGDISPTTANDRVRRVVRELVKATPEYAADLITVGPRRQEIRDGSRLMQAIKDKLEPFAAAEAALRDVTVGTQALGDDMFKGAPIEALAKNNRILDCAHSLIAQTPSYTNDLVVIGTGIRKTSHIRKDSPLMRAIKEKLEPIAVLYRTAREAPAQWQSAFEVVSALFTTYPHLKKSINRLRERAKELLEQSCRIAARGEDDVAVTPADHVFAHRGVGNRKEFKWFYAPEICAKVTAALIAELQPLIEMSEIPAGAVQLGPLVQKYFKRLQESSPDVNFFAVNDRAHRFLDRYPGALIHGVKGLRKLLYISPAYAQDRSFMDRLEGALMGIKDDTAGSEDKE